MFKNNKANIILALFISVCLWAYVTGSVNPEITKKFINIPIKIVNEDSLYSNGLAIDSIDNMYVDITVSGTRTDIKDLEQEDIKVTADLYNRTMGKNYVPLELDLPKGVELENKSTDKILVVIGEQIAKSFHIDVDAGGTLVKGMALVDTKVEPGETIVYGTADNLDKVSRVVAKIDARELTHSAESYRCDVGVLNRNGEYVRFVYAANSKVTVETRLEKTKEVPLKVKIKGKPAEGYEMGQVTKPANIYITGEANVIDDINEVVAEDIDITGLSRSKTFPIEIKLPEGVSLGGNQNLTVEVNIDAPVEKSMAFAPENIEIINLGENLDADIEDSVKVTFRGNKEALDGILKANVNLVVDAEGLDEGEHQVRVDVNLKNDNLSNSVTYNTDKETVLIRINGV